MSYVDPTTRILRTLAKSSHYQTLFNFMKEGPFRLFDNVTDLTTLQLDFLAYLSFYNSIQLEIYLGEVSALVLDNFVYEDAYCFYRNEKRKKTTTNRDYSTPVTTTSPKKESIQRKDSWVFKSRPKKVT